MSETTVVSAFRSGMSLYTARAIKRLSEGKHGEQISRDEMATIIERPCGPGDVGYNSVRTAIQNVIRENGIVWRWNRTRQAWLCLDNSQKVTETRQGIRRAKKLAKRAIQVGISIDTTKLTETERSDHNVNMFVAAIQSGVGKTSTLKKLSTTSVSSEARIETTVDFIKSVNK